MNPDIVLTPMMKQFLDLKAKHPDAIMLFRCGDFYETYSTDAVVAADILGITLTKRNNGKGGQSIEMAGFPHHALDTYLPKLVRAGKRVDLKAFRRAHGTRPLSLADVPELHSILGLKPGSVGPFGLLNGSAALCVPLFLDEDFMKPPALIGIHPNDNTATVWLRTADLAGLLRRYGCEVHAVSF